MRMRKKIMRAFVFYIPRQTSLISFILVVVDADVVVILIS
jgi:hypothetical protein